MLQPLGDGHGARGLSANRGRTTESVLDARNARVEVIDGLEPCAGESKQERQEPTNHLLTLTEVFFVFNEIGRVVGKNVNGGALLPPARKEIGLRFLSVTSVSDRSWRLVEPGFKWLIQREIKR
jgi:hypothetical protein